MKYVIVYEVPQIDARFRQERNLSDIERSEAAVLCLASLDVQNALKIEPGTYHLMQMEGDSRAKVLGTFQVLPGHAVKGGYVGGYPSDRADK